MNKKMIGMGRLSLFTLCLGTLLVWATSPQAFALMLSCPMKTSKATSTQSGGGVSEAFHSDPIGLAGNEAELNATLRAEADAQEQALDSLAECDTGCITAAITHEAHAVDENGNDTPAKVISSGDDVGTYFDDEYVAACILAGFSQKSCEDMAQNNTRSFWAIATATMTDTATRICVPKPRVKKEVKETEGQTIGEFLGLNY